MSTYDITPTEEEFELVSTIYDIAADLKTSLRPEEQQYYSRYARRICYLFFAESPEDVASYLLHNIKVYDNEALLDPDLSRVVDILLRIGLHQGNSTCGYVLGKFYATGRVLKMNPKRAEYVLEHALAAGSFDAAVELGALIEGGDLGEPDHARAFGLFALAASASDCALASIYLGDMFAQGFAVEQDLLCAFYLWSAGRARAQDEFEQANANYRLAPLYLIEDPDLQVSDAEFDPLHALRLYQMAEIGFERMRAERGWLMYADTIKECRKAQQEIRDTYFTNEL